MERLLLNSDSTKALLSETRGREYEGFTPSQWSMASTLVAHGFVRRAH
jgi:hypothetical protein